MALGLPENVLASRLDALATGCSLDSDGGPGMTAFDAMADKFHLSASSADTNGAAAPVDKAHRINLLNWDGKDTNGLFPANGHSSDDAEQVAEHTQ